MDELRAILVSCAGADEHIAVDLDIADVEFEELGYDSLALMETAARIQQQYGVRMPDDVVVKCRTPRDLLDSVNSRLAA